MINNLKIHKRPRLYTAQELSHQALIDLTPEQAHYLHNVMRLKEGTQVRLFDGKNGEWLAILEKINKKTVQIRLLKQIAKQPKTSPKVHLIFTPIKKSRMDFLIEKSVELGVSDFHPILTQNSEVRKINETRIHQQIIEAVEQCERLILPILHPLQKLELMLGTWPKDICVLSCLERHDAPPIQSIAVPSDVAILIGPEGGFTRQEQEWLRQKTTPVSLGPHILRSETAALKAISLVI
ncbi:MAG: 16S rRNA (uracil(1498)-N(3))-methyltransferase [Alphaproteobacteria bacterium]|nr:16S rRNA (uracil(1498)-N(3))-methyltransferase [Alphaproteobacteria bacterium]